VKFERTPRFDNDFKALPREHRNRFLEVVPAFHASCVAYLADPGQQIWPAALRVSRLTNASGVWEMTWSFASPDGRATFEFVTVDGETRVRWRRIGRHRIFSDP
jgi:hypothetical protein